MGAEGLGWDVPEVLKPIGCQDKFHHVVKKKTSLALRALRAYVLKILSRRRRAVVATLGDIVRDFVAGNSTH